MFTPLYLRAQLLCLLFGNLLISDSNKSYTIINWDLTEFLLENFEWRKANCQGIPLFKRDNKSADYGEIRYRQQRKLSLWDVSTSLSRASDPECLRDTTSWRDRALRVRGDSQGMVRIQRLTAVDSYPFYSCSWQSKGMILKNRH